MLTFKHKNITNFFSKIYSNWINYISYYFFIFIIFTFLYYFIWGNEMYLNFFKMTFFQQLFFIFFIIFQLPMYIIYFIVKVFYFFILFTYHLQTILITLDNVTFFQSTEVLLNLNESCNLNLSLIDYFYFITKNSPYLIISMFKIFYFNYLNFPYFILFGLFFFLSALFSLLTISYIGFYGAFILNLFSVILFWLSFLPYLYSILKENNYYYINFGKWMQLNSNYRINFDFLIDNVSLSFSFLTISIAVFVYIFTFSYFRYEPLVDRLFLLLNLFVISMIFLVSSGNFVMLFLGWEMIGLTSFFLINFWATRVGTLKAAFKAFSFNKASDLFLFFAILLVYNLTFNLDILTFISQVQFLENYMINFFFCKIGYLELISLCLMGSAFIKSAQLGAHIWLPDSMEAPVPASALIHSATLVSAGIFLLLRFTTLFELSYFAVSIIGIIGAMTAFYGGIVSAYQSDTKRILAYSTISHCGFLMVVYTTGVLEFVVLYLYVHGFFKAAVFLCVGNVNHFSRNNQDVRRMGQYYKFLPFDCLASFIGLINLSGMPFTFGFYIKHLLFVGLNNNFLTYSIVLVFSLLGAVMGLFYSYKLFYSVFFDFKKSRKIIYNQASALNLNSKFYSNINFSSIIAIIGLMTTAYVVSFYLFYVYIGGEYNFSNFGNFLNYNSFMDHFSSSLNFLMNTSFLNWIVIFLGLALLFTPWRVLVIRAKYIDSFFSFILFMFLFYLFYFIIFNIF